MLTYEYGYIDRDSFDRGGDLVTHTYPTERAAIDAAYLAGRIEFAAVRRIGCRGPWTGCVIPLPARDLWRALWGEIPENTAVSSATVTEPTPLTVVR